MKLRRNWRGYKLQIRYKIVYLLSQSTSTNINTLTPFAYLLGNNLLTLTYISNVAGQTLFSTGLPTGMGDISQSIAVPVRALARRGNHPLRTWPRQGRAGARKWAVFRKLSSEREAHTPMTPAQLINLNENST